MSKRPRFLDAGYANEMYTKGLHYRLKHVEPDRTLVEANTSGFCSDLFDVMKGLYNDSVFLNDPSFTLEFYYGHLMRWTCIIKINDTEQIFETFHEDLNLYTVRNELVREFHWHQVSELRKLGNKYMIDGYLRDPYQQLLAVTSRLPTDLMWVVRDFLIN